MIVPDANLLLYAYDAASPFHSKAAAWWSSCLSGSEPIGLCPAVTFAFVRIGTSRKAFAVESWLKQPMVQVLELDAADVIKALELLRTAGTGGNLTTDAQLAAVCLRHRAVVHTADSDFARFPKIRWRNPLLV